jgi:3-methyl-2-oxobutanoate hydroxymethyltransferase
VITDLLGFTYGFIPRHAKRYEELAKRMSEAISAYAAEVSAGAFPTAEHSSSMDAAVLSEVLGAGALDRATAEQMGDPIPLDRDL